MRSERLFAVALATTLLVAAACGSDAPPRSAASTRATITTQTLPGLTTTTSEAVRSMPSSSEPNSSERLILPSYPADSAIPASVTRNVGIVGNETVKCVWLDLADGTRVAAIWREGTTALFNPLRVLDASGAVRWTEGERKDIGGGTTYGSVLDVLPPQCRTGDVGFFVG